jgi:hypothetical protein
MSEEIEEITQKMSERRIVVNDETWFPSQLCIQEPLYPRSKHPNHWRKGLPNVAAASKPFVHANTSLGFF